MSKIDRVIESAKILSEQMKSSLTSFEQHEVTKSLSIHNNKVNIILTMNGKYETSMVIENPEDIKVDPNELASAFLIIQQSAIADLHLYTKQQMYSVAQTLNESTSKPIKSE